MGSGTSTQPSHYLQDWFFPPRHISWLDRSTSQYDLKSGLSDGGFGCNAANSIALNLIRLRQPPKVMIRALRSPHAQAMAVGVGGPPHPTPALNAGNCQSLWSLLRLSSDDPTLVEKADRAKRLLLDMGGVVSQKESYRLFLASREEQAQLHLDSLNMLLQVHGLLDPQQRQIFLKALLRLSRLSKLLPSALYLPNVKYVGQLLATSSTDIFEGLLNEQRVVLKKYRFCDRSLSAKEKEELLNREAILWANHQHAGILPFLGVFRRNDDAYSGGLCLVSPFLEHGTVIEYLKAYPQASKSLLMKDILEAVSYLHANDIVHGDLKGTNILVNSSGRACISDLGFSRLTAAAALTWTTIQSVASIGTVPWQAPELLEAYRLAKPFLPTSYADVYSLGCISYEIFVGLMPFWDVEPGSPVAPYYILEEVVKNDRRPTKPGDASDAFTTGELTEELWSMMELCWLRDPTLRPSVPDLLKHPFFVNMVDDRAPNDA
ncbi:hypothetical protein NMY22_g14183 [Coprinellus aureogranulatus]|nr:hypothetical protein NMY22_g14183 [Coprinellus aureogranulatus]